MDVVTLLFFDLHHANCEMQLSHFVGCGACEE